ncbi:MAG: phosphatase [Bariatricus sp.]
MKIVLDTHAHTVASGHAYNTIREMAKAAADKGLEAIALTDHAPDMPGSCHLFYFQNLRIVPRNLFGVKLFLGTEANILDENGSVDLPDSVLAEMDLVIASIHPPCYKGAKTKEAITNAYLAAMENPHIDIIGHPDDGRFMVDYEAIVKKAKETHTLLELNNSSLRPGGFRVNTRENDLEMLRFCKKYEVPVSLGSDAHVDVDLARFDLAMEVLEECEFPEELVVNTSLERLEKILAI